MRILGKVREENNKQLFDKAFITYTSKRDKKYESLHHNLLIIIN